MSPWRLLVLRLRLSGLTVREAERKLRTMGVSKRQALVVVSRHKAALGLRDV